MHRTHLKPHILLLLRHCPAARFDSFVRQRSDSYVSSQELTNRTHRAMTRYGRRFQMGSRLSGSYSCICENDRNFILLT